MGEAYRINKKAELVELVNIMAKKKELPKAMSGGIKPLIRAVVATGKVTGKATVRGGKAFKKSFYNTSVKDFLKGNDIKAGVKGFARGVKSGIKTEKAKAAMQESIPFKVFYDKAIKTTEDGTHVPIEQGAIGYWNGMYVALLERVK